MYFLQMHRRLTAHDEYLAARDSAREHKNARQHDHQGHESEISRSSRSREATERLSVEGRKQLQTLEFREPYQNDAFSRA